jgi:hypothetical protein
MDLDSERIVLRSGATFVPKTRDCEANGTQFGRGCANMLRNKSFLRKLDDFRGNSAGMWTAVDVARWVHQDHTGTVLITNEIQR